MLFGEVPWCGRIGVRALVVDPRLLAAGLREVPVAVAQDLARPGLPPSVLVVVILQRPAVGDLCPSTAAQVAAVHARWRPWGSLLLHLLLDAVVVLLMGMMRRDLVEKQTDGRGTPFGMSAKDLVAPQGGGGCAGSIRDDLFADFGLDRRVQSGCDQHRGRGVEIEDAVPPRRQDVVQLVPFELLQDWAEQAERVQRAAHTHDRALEGELVSQRAFVSAGDRPSRGAEARENRAEQQGADVAVANPQDVGLTEVDSALFGHHLHTVLRLISKMQRQTANPLAKFAVHLEHRTSCLGPEPAEVMGVAISRPVGFGDRVVQGE